MISDSHFGDWGGIFGKLITIHKVWLFSLDQKMPTEDETEVYMDISKRILNVIQNLDDNEKREKVIEYSRWLADEYEKIFDKKEFDFITIMFYLYQLITIYSEKDPIIEAQCRREFLLLSN